VNVGRPVVTNGDFVAWLCGSAYSDRAVVWRSEWVGQGIDVLDGVHVRQGKGAVSGMVSGILRHLRPQLFEWAE